MSEQKNDTSEPAPPADDFIRLDQFLKLADVVSSGGEAKHLIRSGVVDVNGEPETRRGRKLRHGDVVCYDDEEFVIESTNADDQV